MNTEVTKTQDNICVRFALTQFITISDIDALQQSARTSNVGGNKIVDRRTDQPIIYYFRRNKGTFDCSENESIQESIAQIIYTTNTQLEDAK
jgi:hypothetical protein